MLDPRLLPENSAQELRDAIVNSGVIEPNVGKAQVADPDIPELTNQNGRRSIVRFGDDYFFSDNETGVLSSTLGYIGVDPPTTRVIVASGGPGDRFEGRFRYLIVFITEEGNRSAAFLPGQDDVAQVEFKTAAVASTIVLANSPAFNPFDYVTDISPAFNGSNLYTYTIQLGTRVNHIGKSWILNAHIVTGSNAFGNDLPIFPAFLAPGGAFNAWGDITGSTPSFSGSDSIVISMLPNSSQGGVTKIGIFRTLTNGSAFFLNATVEATDTQYIDRIGDGQLALSEQLGVTVGFPPIYQGTTKVGGKYLTEIDERYWLAVDNRLYHSLQGDPHSWSPLHSVEFDSGITAIARSGSSLLIFIGNGQPWIISGNVEDNTITKIQLPTTQGCPDWRTIAYAGNTPIWFSNEGICVRAQRPFGQDALVNVITRDRYKFPEDPVFALAKDDTYNLFFEDHVVVFDLARDRITTRSITAEYGFFSNVDGKMYLVEDANFFDADGGGLITGFYKSPALFGTNLHVLKNFRFFNLQSEGDVTYSIFYDGVQVVTESVFTHTGIQKRIRLPNDDAYYIEVQLESDKKIHNYSIEYTQKLEDEI